MRLVAVGLNHKTAPIRMRERVAVPRNALPDVLRTLRDRCGEAVLVSTCNRTEVYSVSYNPDASAGAIEALLAEYGGVDSEDLSPHLYRSVGLDAARHLFRVASGLDSMMLGESEILGQVRNALAAASESGSVQVPLSRLFHGAIRAGRRAREETDVSRNSLSLSYAGVQLVQRAAGGLTGLRALLVGAGEAGRLLARALRTTGVSDLLVANRTPERAAALAERLSGRTVPLEEAAGALAHVDVAVMAAGARTPVFDLAALEAAMAEREGHPLVVLDMSVPRSVDPRAGELPGVRLFNIDDLSTITEETLESRREAAEKVETIVEEELARFSEWWDSLEAVELVKSLRERAETVRQRELAKAMRRLGDLDPDQANVVEALTRALTSRLMHDPTTALKTRLSKTQLQAIRDLFQL